MALDATIGGVASNSYGTLAEANEYFENQISSHVEAWWDASITGDDELALVTATIRLEQKDYKGTRVSETQRLKFPRYNVLKIDGLGTYYLPTEIPQEMKYVQFEYALALLKTTTSGGGTGVIKSLKIGNSVESVFDTTQAVIDTSAALGLVPMHASRWLSWFTLNSSGVPMVRA